MDEVAALHIIYVSTLTCSFSLPMLTPDDRHVVHTRLVAVGQLLEAHLGLAVHGVLGPGLHLPLPL